MRQETFTEENDTSAGVTTGLIALIALSGVFFLLYKTSGFRFGRQSKPRQKLDIEIRYETEKNADTAFSAQNTAKIVKMVLTPLEKQIKKEDAKLILVYGGDTWEMRMASASDNLKHSVRRLLEAKEW